MHQKTSGLTASAVLATATMIIAGGLAVASNTGFKINKPLALAGAGSTGNNWISIPYFNPYVNGAGLCAQLGLVSTGAVRASLLTIDPVTGASQSATCGTPAANLFTWKEGQGVRIRNAGAGAPTSAIIVGSHNPSRVITIPDTGNGNIGSFWFAVPYHTTWVTAADLCISTGMTSAGGLRGSVGRINAATGAFNLAHCGVNTANFLPLIPGEAVRLREPVGPISFVPSHF